jgi:hypothetical protein
VQTVHVPGAAVDPGVRVCRFQVLQFQFQGGQDIRVQQVTQAGVAQQLPQQVGIQRQGSGPLFGQRGVVVVHPLPDPREQQRGSKRRGLVGVHRHQPHAS